MLTRFIAAILIILPFSVTGQKKISGKILDNKLKPLRGAYIESLDRTIFTQTDNTGYYSMELPYTVDTVKIWYLGMGIEKVVIKNSMILNYILFPEVDYRKWPDNKINDFLQHRDLQRMKLLKEAGLRYTLE